MNRFLEFLLSILKWLGLLHAADGFLANLLDIDFMRKLDLLRGFLGVYPHAVGILLYFGVSRATAAQKRTVSADVVDKWRARAALAGVVFLTLFVVATFIPLPQDRPALGEARWWLAAALYILFYGMLGASEE